MAIDSHQFRMIVESGVKGRALSAGYPDLLVRWEDIPGHEQMLSVPRGNTVALQRLHSWEHPIHETRDVLLWFGLKLDVIDCKVIHGCERVVDLNHPQALGEYDLVIDPGTTEHCFNIAQAAINLAGAVKLGGFISQAIPMSMFNHGYYNLNPKWFADFYSVNGFEIKRLMIRCEEGVYEPIDVGGRYGGVPDNCVLCCMAQRVKIQDFVFPLDS